VWPHRFRKTQLRKEGKKKKRGSLQLVQGRKKGEEWSVDGRERLGMEEKTARSPPLYYEGRNLSQPA